MTSGMLDTLRGYFQFPFVRYALAAGVLIALCSSLLGVTLVLRRLSCIGDGLSHVAFGALAAAAVLNVPADMLVVYMLMVPSIWRSQGSWVQQTSLVQRTSPR